MNISFNRARAWGLVAIVLVLLLQAVNSFGCYQHDLVTYLKVTAFFLGIPLLLPVVALFTRKPLRAVGACALLAPWLVLAFYTDCVRPYEGGGASMIYVVVLMWGSVTSLLGFLVTPFITQRLGLAVLPR